jgi:hypothetical protein
MTDHEGRAQGLAHFAAIHEYPLGYSLRYFAAVFMIP